MLSLHNIGKTYISKGKQRVEALKNVNINLEDRGLVFILGKSGSGKSTLLNLLGGLDSPTNGEIFVDGVSMQNFSQSDYAAYRNNYVGFIFQEFNLLSDFNVRENVALALKLTKSDGVDGKISDVLKKVGLNDGYLNRRIDEMSGGEKQRIAIARALIKNSKLILADEPTGNLDSATGESVWNLLKNLSRERLVIVVSHDRESAEKYADRIIEIADGCIISDKGEQPSKGKATNVKPARKGGLSLSARLKMAFNNLMMRKVKTISVILVAIFSILSILVTQICLSYSPEAALSDYITQYGINYFTVAQSPDDQSYHRSTGKTFKYGSKKYIGENCRYIYNGLVESKQDILDFGLKFVGEALELNDESYYTTTEQIEEYYNGGNGLVEIDGGYVAIVKEFHPIEFLIGKKVKDLMSFKKDSILAGVIQSDGLVGAHILPEFFHNKNFDGLDAAPFMDFNRNDNKEVDLHLGDKSFDGPVRFYDYTECFLHATSDVVLTADGICGDEADLNLGDNEIVLPYEMYAQIFGAQSKWYYISPDLKTVLNTPAEIGRTFELKLSEHGTGEVYETYGEVKLAGVLFVNHSIGDTKVKLLANHNLIRQIVRDFFSPNILIQSSSVKNLTSFTTALRRDHQCYIKSVGIIDASEKTPAGFDYIEPAQIAYSLEEQILYFNFIFLGIGAILLIILVLLVINLISFSIAGRKKEIGILSAIGASNRDITSIFLIETGIIAVISFVVNLALSFTFAGVANILFSKAEFSSILLPFLRVDILTVVTLTALSFGLLLLAALIPIRKIIKLKPVDAIRNI